jgi:transcription elongation factor Elf1
MFYVGQEVVCINDSDCQNELIRGKSYIIRNIFTCPKCEILWVDVGVIPIKIYCGTECGMCGYRKYEKHPKAWHSSERFVPIDHSKNKKVTYKEILEEVPCFSN